MRDIPFELTVGDLGLESIQGKSIQGKKETSKKPKAIKQQTTIAVVVMDDFIAFSLGTKFERGD